MTFIDVEICCSTICVPSNIIIIIFQRTCDEYIISCSAVDSSSSEEEEQHIYYSSYLGVSEIPAKYRGHNYYVTRYYY